MKTIKSQWFCTIPAMIFVLMAGCSDEIVKTVSQAQSKVVSNRLLQARAGIHAIHIRMWAAVYSHGKARKGRMEVFARGANLRSEIWSPTDNLLDLTVVCNKRFVHLIPDQSICETGPVSILDSLPISLPYPNIPAIFAGLGPAPENAMVFRIGNDFLLKSPPGQGYYKLRVRLNPLKVLFYELSTNNKRYKVTQKRFKSLNGLLIPYWIRAESRDKLIQLRYKTVEINPELANDVFKCECPGNFTVRRLD